jgi:hypothetical protein
MSVALSTAVEAVGAGLNLLHSTTLRSTAWDNDSLESSIAREPGVALLAQRYQTATQLR